MGDNLGPNGLSIVCPVCRVKSTEHFLHVDGRDYFRCNVCETRFLDPAQYVGRDDELAQYRLHENEPGDPAYCKFLSKLAEPLLQKLGRGLVGLDYGCGPGPALAEIMREAGHGMALYDPFFYPDQAPLDDRYDFITCTEVAEHFHHPAREFDRLNKLMRPDGWLGMMTCFQTDDARFADWHYRKDPTHVVFYRQATFQVIASARGWHCEFPVKDVVLMQKLDS